MLRTLVGQTVPHARLGHPTRRSGLARACTVHGLASWPGGTGTSLRDCERSCRNKLVTPEPWTLSGYRRNHPSDAGATERRWGPAATSGVTLDEANHRVRVRSGHTCDRRTVGDYLGR